MIAVFAVVSGSVAGTALADEKESVGSGVPTAGATTDYLSSVDAGTLARQEELMKFKSWLIQLPGIYESGFVESANFAAISSTTLLWAGSSPLQTVAREEAARRGIKLAVQPVRYSRSDLQKATDTLWASANSARWNGFVITGVVGTGLSHDGVIVQGHYDGISAAEAENRLSAAIGFAKSLTAEVADVRITAARTNLVTRSTDTAPFNAGGMMRGADGGGCTSGFGIWLNGISRTTTARHCTSTPFRGWDRSEMVYGSTVRRVDGAGAQVLTGGGYFWMFDGAWNDPNGYRKTVVGFADLSVGDWVCASGANSGVHCNIQVDNLLDSHNDGFGPFWTISATQRDNGAAAAQGDSGGPVLVAYAEPGWTTVGAAGMIQWGLNDRSCGARVPARCFNQVGFSSMRTLVNEIGPGASLRTG